MSPLIVVEVLGLYLIWRLGLLRRVIDGLDAALTRTANGRAGSAKRIAQSMVRVVDYLELTRGARLSNGGFWVGYLLVGTLIASVLAPGLADLREIPVIVALLALVALLVVIGLIVALLIGNSLYNRAVQKNMTRMLPEALGIMGDEIAAGHSVEAAVQRVALQFGKPINQEFSDALIKMVASGGLISIDQALAEIAQNPLYQSDTLDQAALTIAVVRPLGGDLGELLSDLARLLHQREATEREIRIQLAPGRQAAWTLVVMIVGLFIGLTLFPLFSGVLYGTYIGRFVIILGAIIISVCVYWIIQINSQDV